MPKRYYAYVWYHDDMAIYVGKGTGARFMSHINRDDFPEPDESLQVKIFYCEDEAEALDLEAWLYTILKEDEHPLLNKAKLGPPAVATCDYFMENTIANWVTGNFTDIQFRQESGYKGKSRS